MDSEPAAPSAITKCHEETFRYDDEEEDRRVVVDVTLEYKPRSESLSPREFSDLLDYEGDIDTEWMLVDLYERIIEVIYPGYSGRENPWEYVPMVVMFDVEYRYWESGDRLQETLTLGSYH